MTADGAPEQFWMGQEAGGWIDGAWNGKSHAVDVGFAGVRYESGVQNHTQDHVG